MFRRKKWFYFKIISKIIIPGNAVKGTIHFFHSLIPIFVSNHMRKKSSRNDATNASIKIFYFTVLIPVFFASFAYFARNTR